MLAKKLHLKPGMRLAVVNAPDGFARTLGKMPAGVVHEPSLRAGLDVALMFVLSKKELTSRWPKATASIKDDGALWVAYPKKSSGVDSDLTMSADWEVSRNSPWQPVASIAVDEMWSAVRFRQRPGLAQARAARQEEVVRDADGTVCIDRTSRVITAPTDLGRLLDKNAKAASLFETLSFTNRREYVTWILDAKKPETRAARLSKTVEMLSAGRKNPSDK
jgi:uncharacterized protein YdeI (YjbR/CyaY-like superfamily)